MLELDYILIAVIPIDALKGRKYFRATPVGEMEKLHLQTFFHRIQESISHLHRHSDSWYNEQGCRIKNTKLSRSVTEILFTI